MTNIAKTRSDQEHGVVIGRVTFEQLAPNLGTRKQKGQWKLPSNAMTHGYFLRLTADLSSAPGENFATFLAAILMGFPV